MAIPVSLIFNELLSNAYKHAFTDRQGKVEVTLAQAGIDALLLRVSDDGAGLPRDFDWQTASTLGMKIVRNLTEQIDGRLAVENGAGITFQVTFPLKIARKHSISGRIVSARGRR